MSIKNGFGSARELLLNKYVVGTRVETSNSNIVFILPSKNEKRIFTISAGYSIPDGSSITSLGGGRLLIVRGKFENYHSEILPLSLELPPELSGVTVEFDAPIGGGSVTHLTWPNGLVIPDGQSASIILTCSKTDGSTVYPAIDTHNAFLNVNGITGGTDKIFKNV